MKKLLLVLSIIGAVTLSSCKKDKPAEKSNTTEQTATQSDTTSADTTNSDSSQSDDVDFGLTMPDFENAELGAWVANYVNAAKDVVKASKISPDAQKEAMEKFAPLGQELSKFAGDPELPKAMEFITKVQEKVEQQ